MTINKNETRLFISPTPVDAFAIADMTEEDALAAFEAINDWVEVGEVENLGEIGDAAQSIPFVSIGRQRVRKLKGARDAGEQTVVVGRDPLDDGQDELIAAEKTNYQYAFKMEMNDAKTPSFSDSILYYAGLVNTKRTGLGDGNTVTRRTFTVGVQMVLEVGSAALSVPVNLILPSIIGSSLAQGAVLTADVGSWSNSPTSHSYQWQSDTSGNGTFANISGATNRTHTIAAGQGGDAIRVQVTATNAAGNSSAANSLPVGLAGS